MRVEGAGQCRVIPGAGAGGGRGRWLRTAVRSLELSRIAPPSLGARSGQRRAPSGFVPPGCAAEEGEIQLS